MSTLRSANEQFEQIMLIRSDAIFEAAMGAAKVAREAAQMTFGKLCEMVNALAIVNGDAAYKYIIDRINSWWPNYTTWLPVAVPVRNPMRPPTLILLPTPRLHRLWRNNFRHLF